jgi:hypothetical protein
MTQNIPLTPEQQMQVVVDAFKIKLFEIGNDEAFIKEKALNPLLLKAEIEYLWQRISGLSLWKNKALVTASIDSYRYCLWIVCTNKYLSFNPHEKTAHPVPYGGKLQIIIGYNAYINAGRDKGIYLTPGVSRHGDSFSSDLTALGELVTGKRGNFTELTKDSNDINFYYTNAIVRDEKGIIVATYAQIMSNEDVLKRMGKSKSKDSFWVEWYESMALKCSLLHLCRTVFSDMFSDLAQYDLDNDYSDTIPEGFDKETGLAENITEKVIVDINELLRHIKLDNIANSNKQFDTIYKNEVMASLQDSENPYLYAIRRNLFAYQLQGRGLDEIKFLAYIDMNKSPEITSLENEIADKIVIEKQRFEKLAAEKAAAKLASEKIQNAVN